MMSDSVRSGPMPRIEVQAKTQDSRVRHRKNLDELTQPRPPFKGKISKGQTNQNGQNGHALSQKENLPSHNESVKKRSRQVSSSLDILCQKSSSHESVQKKLSFIEKNDARGVWNKINNVDKSESEVIEMKRHSQHKPKINQEKCRIEKKLAKKNTYPPSDNKIGSSNVKENAVNNTIIETCNKTISKRLFHHHRSNSEYKNDQLLNEVTRTFEAKSTALGKYTVKSSGTDKKNRTDKSQHQTCGEDNVTQRFREGTGKRSCKQYLNSEDHYSLKEWWLDWPPYMGNISPQDINPSGIKLFIRGVDRKGSEVRLEIFRRSGPQNFATFLKEKVELSGCINHDRAVASGVPEEVIQQFYNGIPHHWRKYLWTACSDINTMNSAEPLRVSIVDKSHQKRSDNKILFDKGLCHGNNIEVTSHDEKEQIFAKEVIRSLKRPRNDSRLTPVMEWWCGKEMQSDTEEETIVQKGSREQIPTKRQKPSSMSDKRSSSHHANGHFTAEDTSQSQWSKEQLSALLHAKMAIPTTLTNFWVEVAKHVQGKSPEECKAKSFEEFASPNVRKSRKANDDDAGSHPPTKLYRAGSNLFKKQVREFIREYERKNADDVFTETPNKNCVKHAELDTISSPVVMEATTPASSEKRDIGEEDDDTRLRKVPSIKRAEVDSYVLSLKRQHNHSGENLIERKDRIRKLGGVRMVQGCGSHALEGSISPGGTTNVAIDIGSSSGEEYQDGSESEIYD